MVFEVSKVREIIKRGDKELNNHLSLRISSLLDELIEDLSSHQDDEIELFELLVRLILQADSRLAAFIANLLVPLDTEGSYLLDDHVISESASFLRDYLKKDAILYALKDRENHTEEDSDKEKETEEDEKEQDEESHNK